MSFQLRSEKPLSKSLRRIVRNQMDAVSEELTEAAKGPRDEVVHEVRKSLKKIRAVLRLVRPVIGEKCYRRENTCFRDAARPLTEVRDARILIDTLDKLVEHFQEHISGRSFADLRKALQINLRAVRKRVLDEQNAFVAVAETVSQARERVKGWTDVTDKWSSVGRGLQDTCRQARAAFRDAAADPSVATLHVWRKQVKYLRYQLEVLRPLWPERIEELAAEADRMGRLAGGRP
jgi:CHAD domain-containing protein